MKQSLQLKLGQQLTMTPQLQQAIRLLQLSTLDLQQEIQEALDSNPMLEVEESQDTPEEKSNDDRESEARNGTDTTDTRTASSDDSPQTDSDWNDEIPNDLPVDTSWDDVYQLAPAATSSTPFEGDENSDYDSRRGTTDSLYDHLMWQLNLTPMSDRDRIIAMTLIDAVEPSGMLSTSLEEIFEGLKDDWEELEFDELEAVQHRLQQFDPVGVASQNLSECLLVQLQQFPKDTPYLEAAKTIVRQYLPQLGSRDYRQLMRRTRLKEPELRDAITLIQSLTPRPGDQIASGDVEYVVPDVFVEKREGRWMVELNPDIAPRLRINSDYASMVKRADSSTDNTFLKDNLQEARWFLKSLQSRNETLLKVASCIVEKQRGFLDQGAEAMRPLVLHDIAELVDMHESTISRVTTQKYMHTPQGIFELKYFFSSHVSTESGGECSSTAIRAIIKKLVAAESPQKPLSDSKITALLADQGIKVARRTIAKYRESLGIPPSNERKTLGPA
ncbi:RNA polymerase factor sigma-54 [Marinimicrobium agarilyticum]|uniref:RNA polymerase factor sigma-54 n=1 Tax=Marinimicrobium agarilyticum TaxID=306546 RepID=UPI0004065A42|nr:RNA polymerase factor sigma-54 [Marinimicrobium agarilyticum]